jgi:hypothetical protein
MSTNLQYLVHFIQHRVSEIVYYNTRGSECDKLNSGNKITSSENAMRIRLCPPEESSTQGLTIQGAPATGVK